LYEVGGIPQKTVLLPHPPTQDFIPCVYTMGEDGQRTTGAKTATYLLTNNSPSGGSGPPPEGARGVGFLRIIFTNLPAAFTHVTVLTKRFPQRSVKTRLCVVSPQGF
jgi:hypothetical protein